MVWGFFNFLLFRTQLIAAVLKYNFNCSICDSERRKIYVHYLTNIKSINIKIKIKKKKRKAVPDRLFQVISLSKYPCFVYSRENVFKGIFFLGIFLFFYLKNLYIEN